MKKKHPYFTKKTLALAFASGALFYNPLSLASNFQNFLAIYYANLAELAFLVKNLEIIGGSSFVDPNIKFNGTITVPDPFHIPGFTHNVVTTGSAKNTSNYFLSFGRLAIRATKRMVFSIDVTEPFKSVIKYARDSVVRYATINGTVETINYSPSVSYLVCDKLSIAAGFDFLYAFAALDKAFPSLTPPFFGAGPDVIITNRGSGWAEGWHVGTTYHPAEGTYLGLSYYSQTTPLLKGVSTFSGFPASHDLTVKANFPDLTTFSVTQFFSKDWLVRFQARYTQWNRLRRGHLRNTAGPKHNLYVIFNYQNTWRFELSSRYNFTKQFFVGGLIAYDQTPTNDRDRTLALPEVNAVDLGLQLGYKITPALTVQLNYAHVYYVKTTPLNTVDPNDGTTTVGKANLYANVIGAQFTVNL